MSKDRVLGPAEARERAANFADRMSVLTITTNTDPRPAGAIRLGHGHPIVYVENLIAYDENTPSGQILPFKLALHPGFRDPVSFDSAYPDKPFQGSGSVYFREYDVSTIPEDAIGRKFDSRRIWRYEEEVREFPDRYGVDTSNILYIQMYGGPLSPEEVAETYPEGFLHQTDFVFDKQGRYRIEGRGPGHEWLGIEDWPLWPREREEYQFTERLANVVDIAVDALQTRVDRAQEYLRTNPPKS